MFELLDGAACHRQLGVLDWALSLGFAPGPRLLQRLIVDRFDREPGEPDEEETPRHASAHHGALSSPQAHTACGASTTINSCPSSSGQRSSLGRCVVMALDDP